MKPFIKRLKILLQYDYKFAYLVLLSGALLLAFEISFWYLFLFLLFFVLIFLFSRKTLIKATFFCIVLLFSIGISSLQSPYHESDRYKIISVRQMKSDYGKIYYRYILRRKSEWHDSIISSKYLFYSDQELNSGVIIFLKGKLTEGSSAHYPNGYDYAKQLKYQKIRGIIVGDKIKVDKEEFHVSQISEGLANYYKKRLDENSYGNLMALLFGNKDKLEEEFSQSIKDIGVSHLFVVSGLHVSALLLIINQVFKWLRIKSSKTKVAVEMIFLLSYSFVTMFSVSVIRVVLGYFIRLSFPNVKPLNRFSLNAIIVLTVNPYYLFQVSFQLSYLLSGGLIAGQKIVSHKSKIISSLLMSGYCLVISLPVVINLNGTLNLLGLLYNVVYIPFVTFILLPLSVIVAVIPYIGGHYSVVVSIFYEVTNIFGKITLFTVKFGYMSLLGGIIYYLLLYAIYCYKSRTRVACIIALIVLMIFITNKNFFNLYDEVQFLDLPQGESTLIRSSFNKMNILIDAGERSTNNELGKILISYGIKRLDCIFITHSDSDHIGGLDDLIGNIKVKTIVFNKFDNIEMIAKYHRLGYDVRLVGRGEKIQLGNWGFRVVSPDIDLGNINLNSLVMEVKNKGFRILFCGDIEEKTENHLVTLGDKIEVDLIKLAHHGSKTSTSVAFLNSIKFKEAIISNGYKNTFGFPHQVVIERLKKYQVTSDKKTIIFQRKNNGFVLKKWN